MEINPRTLWPQIDAYLEDSVKHHRITSLETLRNYGPELDKFLLWMQSEEPGFLISGLTGTHLAKYHTYLNGYGYAAPTIKMWTSIIRGFLTWLQATNQLQNPLMFPALLRSVIEQTELMDLLTPQDIFLVRKKRDVKIEVAAWFETAICTGLRASEMQQLRACDIQWEKKPMDLEEGVPSRYVAATIQLYKHTIKTKRRRQRVAFLSVLAGRLIEQLLEKFELPHNADAPIFPFERDSIRQMIVRTQDYTPVKVRRRKKQNRATKKGCLLEGLIDRHRSRNATLRSVTLSDVNPEIFSSDEYKKRLEAMQRKKEEERAAAPSYARHLSELPQGTQELRPFTIHGFRNMYCCYMYFRNFHGERNNMERLIAEMGHVDRQSTMAYLNHFDLVNNDVAWKMLWTGTASDWRMLR